MAKSQRQTNYDPDAIRIVPLYVPGTAVQPIPEAAPAPPAARLTYRNGPLISAVEVFTIFWGGAWTKAPQAAMISQLNQFFDFILTSALIDQLTEYNVKKHAITHGRRTGTTTISTPALNTSVTDSAIRKILQQEIATGKRVPKPTPNTLYFIYVQPGVRVVLGGSASCQAFCGYHNATSGAVFYAVMPYPGCSGVRGAWRRSMRSPRPARMSCARRSPIRFRARAGTTTPTAKSATSAPGKPRKSASTPCSSNGRTKRIGACEVDRTIHIPLRASPCDHRCLAR